MDCQGVVLTPFLLFQLWVKIVNGDIQDSTRTDLYEYIVDFLTSCSDHELVWKHAEWLLERSEEVRSWILLRNVFEIAVSLLFDANCLVLQCLTLLLFLNTLVHIHMEFQHLAVWTEAQ